MDKAAILNYFIRIRFFIAILISLIISKASNAQLCQGSLGDPVVNINFGSGPNFGPSLGATVTNTSYIANSCPNDGFYTVSNNSPGCFNNSWHNLTQDHTPGDVNGYMMVVNASFNAGDFYVERVDGLCSGITYEFAAWLMNTQRLGQCGGTAINPNVTFKIETTSGIELLKSETGNIPSTASPQWQQYGAFFTVPSGTTSVVIRMTNNASGGCGNDIALDDITFRPCGAQVTATVNGATGVKDICKGDLSPYQFSGNVSSGNSSYQWQRSNDNGTTWIDIPGATSTSFTQPAITTEGSYMYRLSVSQTTDISVTSCRVASNVLTININPIPVPSAVNTGPKCEGGTIELAASQGATYSWTGPAGFSSTLQNPILQNVSFNNSGKYIVKVTTDKGCTNLDSTVVDIYKNPVVQIANRLITICEGQTAALSATGTDIETYLWAPAESLNAANIANPVASPAVTTKYILTVTNAVCDNTDSVVVSVNKKPVANAGADQEIIQGQSVVLNGVVEGEGISIIWTPAAYLSNPTIPNPIASPVRDTTYTLTVTSNNGCGVSSDKVVVRVFLEIRIPNAFSPNGDGINDTWNIPNLDKYPDADVVVYNRYGQQVFSFSGAYKAWDGSYKGKPLPIGTYYYIVDTKKITKKYVGWVFITR